LAISGLGTVFVQEAKGTKAWLRLIVVFLYRLVLGHKNLKTIFQNSDDRIVLLKLCALPESKAIIIPGSGVRLADYSVTPEPSGIFVVTFAARLLKDKGLMEFIQAARILRDRGVAVCFRVVGAPDLGNPSSISSADLDSWNSDGLIEFLGYRKNIAEVFSSSHLVALPSYREG